MNKEQFHNIYQGQLKLVRFLNTTLKNEWKMDKHTFELNKLNQYEEISTQLQSLDLNLYTVFPFDSLESSSYILYHRTFGHHLSLIPINLDQSSVEIQKNTNTKVNKKFYVCTKFRV